MNEQLRKRLEGAAEKYQEEYETTERVAFTHGAIWGYKQAEKEMMKDEEALRKRVADTLFILTKTEELSVERVLEVAEQLTKGILS